MAEPRTRPATRATRATRSADDVNSKSDPESEQKSNAKPSPGKPVLDARRAAALAAAHVRELTGKAPEGVTGLERLDDGWRVGIEVLESRRIPDSIDLLAVYSVELDGHGELVGYRREQRYHRGRPEERS